MNRTNQIAIKIENLSKKFLIGKGSYNTLRETIGSIFSRKSKKIEFIALDNITLEIRKGDVIGVIGKNGAGKSTLLKVLSKITQPSHGRVEILGNISSLLEVGTGFHPELTGRENIYLNGSLLGMSKKEIKSKLENIISFSGVEQFIDTPIKHYSSGMQVRLAFAVAANLDSEILLIDEVLAVGDYEFRKKCMSKMNSLSHDEDRTIVFVSHNLAAIQSLCNRCVLLEKGKIVAEGEPDHVINQYKFRQKDQATSSLIDYRQEKRSQEVKYSKLGNNKVFEIDEEVILNVEIESTQKFKNLLLEFHIYNQDDEKICEIYSWDSGQEININNEKVKLEFSFGKMRLKSGDYFADLKIKNTLHVSAIDFIERIPLFSIKDTGRNSSLFKKERQGDIVIVPKITKR